MPGVRKWVMTAIVALGLTLATSATQVDTTARYAEIMGCETACQAAAAGILAQVTAEPKHAIIGR